MDDQLYRLVASTVGSLVGIVVRSVVVNRATTSGEEALSYDELSGARTSLHRLLQVGEGGIFVLLYTLPL